MLVDQDSDIPVISVLRKIPEITSQATSFLWAPRKFTASWLGTHEGRLSGWAALASCLAVVSLFYGLYAIAFRTNPLGRIFHASGSSESKTKHETLSPRFIRFSFFARTTSRYPNGTAVLTNSVILSPLPSFVFPEIAEKGPEEPQLLLFTIGLINVFVENVIPGGLNTKTAQSFFTPLYALIITLCFLPSAHILGSRIGLADAFDFTLIAASFSLLWLSILMLAATLLLYDVLRINLVEAFAAAGSGRKFVGLLIASFIWTSLCYIPLVRSFYCSYQVLYGFGSAKIWGAAGIAVILSVAVGPLVYIPAFYLWMRGREVIEKIA